MKKYIYILLIFCACSENYSNGERVGFVTQFSRTGNFWKSWEGHLNMTQTGMNSSQAWNFSFDNNKDESSYASSLIARIDSAVRYGYKVRIHYHQAAAGLNCFGQRGMTNSFVDGVDILDMDKK